MNRLLSSASLLVLMAALAAPNPSWAQETEVPEPADTETDGAELSLGDADITLRRIVVGAGRDKVAIETPQAVSVVDQEDLNREQATTIGDAIRDLPGVVTVGSDRVLGESFNIRGFGTATSSDETRIIVQVDGATKFHEQYRLGSLFTDPELYKQVEVLRGPGSSTLYGAGALAGVVRLETKDASDFLSPGDPWGFRQKLEFSDNGPGFLSSSILALQPAEGLDLLATFNYRRAEEIKDGDGDALPGSDFEAPSYLIKGSYAFGTDRAQEISLSFQRWTYDDSDTTLTQTETSPVFGDIDREITDTTAIGKYSFTPQDNDLIDLEITVSYSESENVQENASQEGAFGGSSLFQDTTYAYEFIEGRIENTSLWEGERWENYLTLGVQLQLQERTADAISEGFPPGPTSVPAGELEGIAFHPGGESELWGFYLQNEFIWNEKLTLIPGIRFDTRTLEAGPLVTGNPADSSDDAISPKLAALYQVNDAFGLLGSIAYTERLPVIDEIFDGRSGNPLLERETALNYEGGFTLSFDDVFTSGDGFNAKLVYFYNDVQDLIERENTASPFFNVGEAEIQGLEVEASYDSRFWFARLAYSRIRGEGRESPGDPVEPLLSIPADEVVVTLGGRLPSRGLDGGIRFLGAFEQDRVPTGEPTTDGYGVVDLFGSWKSNDGPLEGLIVRLGAENVFDKLYREALSTNLVGDNAKGRTLKLTLTYQF